MKGKIVEGLQKALVKVSINSIGRSIPATMYEREIPKEVLKKFEDGNKEMKG
ncbi:exodeoxyribonuclease V subunit alpha [Clostridium sp. Marseille-P2415]|uniref:exodeoxyribonuclease V subunit alpha n=1 Tax=Clostridium sp. Marseille-P2415 TaxID=1805471 RepID=UPI0009883DE2|nr:exodeoxyribonuclease V subunit alpha [Clostridium sp. Marseille-P2415]